ncbi:MAG TPA: T9SS type A sorting domain-containing protein [Bacteroidia bacterium]|nr:T9SS type A sorting domain-containing protein [Bacteroidia bacterium]
MKKKATTLTIMFFGLNILLNAQCISSGLNSPSIISEDTSIGNISWANTGSSCTSDNSRSTAGALILGDITNYLVATGFGFSIPPTAIICGITVEIEKSSSGILENINDNSVRIVKGGTMVGMECASGGLWPSSDNYSSYSGGGGLWGTAWTAADINSVNFGVAVSADLSGIVLPTARIDHIRIIIDYDILLPIELISFEAKCTDKKVEISWAVASQNNNDFFTIERTANGFDFEIIGTVDGAGNSNQIIYYSFVDTVPLEGVSYYRLKQTDFNGEYEYYNLLESVCDGSPSFVLYPNPASDKLTMKFNYLKNENYMLIVQDALGRTVQTITNIQSEKIEIEQHDLESGFYFLQLQTDKQIIASEKLIVN